MNIHNKFSIGTIHSLLQRIGKDSCRFFEHATYRVIPAEEKNKHPSLEIVLSNGFSLYINVTAVNNGGKQPEIYFGHENSLFQRLPVKSIGGDLYECSSENLCFFIDGIMGKLAEIEQLVIF